MPHDLGSLLRSYFNLISSRYNCARGRIVSYFFSRLFLCCLCLVFWSWERTRCLYRDSQRQETFAGIRGIAFENELVADVPFPASNIITPKWKEGSAFLLRESASAPVSPDGCYLTFRNLQTHFASISHTHQLCICFRYLYVRYCIEEIHSFVPSKRPPNSSKDPHHGWLRLRSIQLRKWRPFLSKRPSI
jgi:hypothetical protein